MSKKNAQITIEDLKLSPEEMESLVKGAQKFLAAEPDPRDDETQPNLTLTPGEKAQS